MSDSVVPTFQMPSPYPASGEVIDGKYQIDRILGEGGMGAVAKAMHLVRRAPVALKFMSPAVMRMAGAVERFVNEGVAASQIDSDHVVKVLDVGQMKSGAPYLVMEYLEGCDLAELLVREGRPGFDVPRSVHFVVQALRGLQVAHAAGIVHRDMKPSNCFVMVKDNEPDFVKLVDFGISKVQQPDGVGNITRTNSALGTPLYMSPEQARSPRDVDLRTDLYSVAVILYELLTGQTPFHSDTGEFTEILFKIFTMDPPPIQGVRPDVPDGLAALIHRTLDRDPKARFASASEMGEALAPWADERSQVALHRLRNAGRGPRAVGSVAPMAPPLPPLGSLRPIGQSIVPLLLDARASAEGAMAQTLGATQPSVDARHEREREPGLSGKRNALVLVLIGAFLVAIFGIGALAAMRARARADLPSGAGSASATSSSEPVDPASSGAAMMPAALPPAPAILSATATATAPKVPSSSPPVATGTASATAAVTAPTTATATATATATTTTTTTPKLGNMRPQN